MQAAIRCKWLVAYTSAVTGSRLWSGYATKAQADKDARNLQREGAKDVQVLEYGKK